MPVAISPVRPPRTEPTTCPAQPVQPPHHSHQRPSMPNPGDLVQLTVFVAMPTPSRPFSTSRSCPCSPHLASTSTSPSPSHTYHDHPFAGTLSSPHTHQSSLTGFNVQQELTLAVTITPFIPDLLPSPFFSTPETQKQPGPS